MYRLIYFLATITFPVLFSWWLFLPMAILYVYFAKKPYELIIVGVLFDNIYYFGGNFVQKHFFALGSLIVVLIAVFLETRVHWRKIF